MVVYLFDYFQIGAILHDLDILIQLFSCSLRVIRNFPLYLPRICCILQKIAFRLLWNLLPVVPNRFIVFGSDVYAEIGLREFSRH